MTMQERYLAFDQKKKNTRSDLPGEGKDDTVNLKRCYEVIPMKHEASAPIKMT